VSHFCPHCGRKHTIHGGFFLQLGGVMLVMVGLFAFLQRHELHHALCWR
jgi:hypothetical protein